MRAFKDKKFLANPEIFNPRDLIERQEKLLI
jgi:hypothetical protein